MNKDLFTHKMDKNEAGGNAYKLKPIDALTQYVMTGTFSNTYYTNAKEDLQKVMEWCDQVDTLYLAQLAVYGRKHGYMKDTPAFLTAYLAAKDLEKCKKIFNTVIDNGRMLRGFVQIIRSGVVGRKSLGHGPKKLVANWINNRSMIKLFNDSVGQSPSIADCIKLSRPKPVDIERENFYKYLLGKSEGLENLPAAAIAYEVFKADQTKELPNYVEFRKLTQLPLTKEHWERIASDAPWHMTRMNLNTFQRHGVFENKEVTQLIADRLSIARGLFKYKSASA